MPMPDLTDLFDLNEGQHAGITLLAESLAASDLPETSKERLLTERLNGYRERNRDRSQQRWGLDLVERAAQARVDHERSRNLHRYSRDVQRGHATPPRAVAAIHPEPTHWLGHCLRCDREMWTFCTKPRVPICQGCRR